MALYVHADEKNAPYLDAISFNEKDGYDEKPYLEPDKMVILMHYTTKCYLDKDGNIVVPNIQPEVTETDKQVQALQLQLKMMQSQFLNMMLVLAKGGGK